MQDRPLWVNVKYISRMIKRFTLSTTRMQAESIPMRREVMPTTDADKLLCETKITFATKDISAAGSAFVPFKKVPDGKRWRLIYVSADATTGNSSVNVQDADGLPVRLTALGTSERLIPFHPDAYMEEGWEIGMPTTNNGADTTISMFIWLTEEEAF